MTDDPKIVRIYPNRVVHKATRVELEREIEILKSVVLSLTEEVRERDKLIQRQNRSIVDLGKRLSVVEAVIRSKL